jgi:glycosyltransferase involved in cell wall biosynthesis
MPTGPAVYLRNLINSLAEIDKQNSYVLYLEELTKDGFIEEITKKNPNFTTNLIKKSLSWTQIDLSFDLFTNPIDVFFSSVHTIPVQAGLLKPNRMKFVSMIHGLEYLTNQNSSPLQPLIMGTTLLLSNKIVVPSESTKQKVLKHFSTLCPETKIQVIHEGLKEIYRQPSLENLAKEVLKEFDLVKNKYLVFISTIQPRKNIPLTIKAFSKVSEKHPDIKLCIVGKKGWNFDESLEAPKKYRIENKVQFLGPIPDIKLKPLLDSSAGFVNFSLDEGFGLTLIEALSSGIPCAVSNIQAFKEIGRDFPIYANPNSEDEITAAIEKIITTDLNNEAIQNQTAHAKKFTWTETAKITLSVLESVVKSF